MENQVSAWIFMLAIHSGALTVGGSPKTKGTLASAFVITAAYFD